MACWQRDRLVGVDDNLSAIDTGRQMVDIRDAA